LFEPFVISTHFSLAQSNILEHITRVFSPVIVTVCYFYCYYHSLPFL